MSGAKRDNELFTSLLQSRFAQADSTDPGEQEEFYEWVKLIEDEALRVERWFSKRAPNTVMLGELVSQFSIEKWFEAIACELWCRDNDKHFEVQLKSWFMTYAKRILNDYTWSADLLGRPRATFRDGTSESVCSYDAFESDDWVIGMEQDFEGSSKVREAYGMTCLSSDLEAVEALGAELDARSSALLLAALAGYDTAELASLHEGEAGWSEPSLCRSRKKLSALRDALA